MTMTMAKCTQCGKFSVPGPANCEHCGASMRGAARVEIDAAPVAATTIDGKTQPYTPVTANRVIVTDFDMPFGSMVMFMIKWALASIPAFIVLFILGAILFSVLYGVGGVTR